MEKNAVRLLAKAGTTDQSPTVSTSGIFSVGHVAGARDPRKSTIIGLYRNGLVSVELGVKYGAKPKDHLEAMNHGVTMDQLIAAGVNLRQMSNARNRMEGVVVAALEKAEAAAKAAAPKVGMVIRRASGEAKVVMTASVKTTLTAQQAAVAVAVVEAAKMAKAKKDREAKAKNGFVATLSAEEQAELVRRNEERATPTYTYLPVRG